LLSSIKAKHVANSLVSLHVLGPLALPAGSFFAAKQCWRLHTVSFHPKNYVVTTPIILSLDLLNISHTVWGGSPAIELVTGGEAILAPQTSGSQA
jgi:hypothetical protein